MRISQAVSDTRDAIRAAKQQGKRIALVPTMGALHEGHLSLVRAARSRCDYLVASIFVNPTQFGPNEDFAKYPRSFETDRQKLQAEAVDLLFHPSVEEMYPAGAVTFVNVDEISERLDGRSRPGHFRGVATIVATLFHIIEPAVVFFGQKDAAQVAIIRRMARDLMFPVEIAVGAIVREADGLAMSSRNAYLSLDERRQATVLSRSLCAVQESYRKGERNVSRLIETAKHIFASEPAVRVDYIEIVSPETLAEVSVIQEGSLLAVAAFVGTTRLIDNVMFGTRQ